MTGQDEMHWTPVWAAVGFALLLGAAYGWVSPPPGVHEPGPSIVSWVGSEGSRMQTQVWLVMLAWLPGGALFALVHHRMRGAPAACFLLGGAFLMSLTTLGALLRLGLARRAAELSPETVRLLGDLDVCWGPLATIPTVLLATALAVSTQRGDFPRWLLPVSGVLALWQLAETVTIVGQRGFVAPGGPFNQIGALIFGVWILAQGVAASRPHRMNLRIPESA